MKIYSVQYLRGFAALLVLLAHSLRYPLSAPPVIFNRVGSFGVALFFVISGFIMVLICGRESFDRKDFYKRRILRVVPLYWIATTAVALMAILAPSAFKNTEFTVRQYILSLLFVPHYRPNGEIVPLLKLGWTLNLEMFFYACFGALAFVGASKRVAILSIIFVALAALGTVVDFQDAILHSYTLFDLMSFCFGMWAGLLTLSGYSLERATMLRAMTLAIALVCSTLGFVLFPTVPVNHTVTAVQATGSALLLLAALGFEPSLPRLRWLTLIGDASYSIYLVHIYFVGFAVVVLRRTIPSLPFATIVVIGIVAGGTAGLLTHLLIEKPIMAMTARRDRRRPRAVADAALPLSDELSPALIADEPKPMNS